MKKLLLFLMIFLSFSLVNAQVHGINFNDKIILRINGHDHSLPGDILNEFDKSWKEYKGNFERDMIGMGNNDAKVIGGHLNNKITELTFQKGADDQHIILKMKINNNRLHPTH